MIARAPKGLRPFCSSHLLMSPRAKRDKVDEYIARPKTSKEPVPCGMGIEEIFRPGGTLYDRESFFEGARELHFRARSLFWRFRMNERFVQYSSTPSNSPIRENPERSKSIRGYNVVAGVQALLDDTYRLDKHMTKQNFTWSPCIAQHPNSRSRNRLRICAHFAFRANELLGERVHALQPNNRKPPQERTQSDPPRSSERTSSRDEGHLISSLRISCCWISFARSLLTSPSSIVSLQMRR